MARRRLDTELIRRGIVADREAASAAVEAGLVTVGGIPATTVATLVDPEAPLRLGDPDADGRFVSRGGQKLAGALRRFTIDVTGADCLDVGASTGGFTDCLLRAGAARVIAMDVGYGQLAWSLRTDDRVHVLERTNIRDVHIDELPFVPEVVVADLSFLSLRTAMPSLAGSAIDQGRFVLLVKPQFEVAPHRVGAGGIVRDPILRRDALGAVVDGARREGLSCHGAMASPIRGRSGNVEFLLFLVKDGRGAGFDLDATLAEAAAEAEAIGG